MSSCFTAVEGDECHFASWQSEGDEFHLASWRSEGDECHLVSPRTHVYTDSCLHKTPYVAFGRRVVELLARSAFLACHQCYCAGSSLAWG